MRFPSPLQERGALRAPKTPTMQRFRLHHWVSCFQVEHECPLSTQNGPSGSRLTHWHRQTRKLGTAFSASALLGIEGIAAASYFRGWHGTP
jgi:hypothetical protein